jgi:hypothetical protein
MAVATGKFGPICPAMGSLILGIHLWSDSIAVIVY